MSLTVKTCRWGELGPPELAEWEKIRRRNPALESPYFHPEFMRCVAAVRGGVHVGVLFDGPRTVGFFPFEIRPFGLAGPVGGPISDFQGLIVDDDLQWRAEDLIRQMGVRAWRFDHLIAGQGRHMGCTLDTRPSPVIDLAGGYSFYRAQKQRSGSLIEQIERKRRKLTREVGAWEFQADVRDRRPLDDLYRWKSAQCRRTGTIDFFSFPWIRTLVEDLLETRSPAFAGMLSVLSAGGRTLALHLGMRSARIWHWWFASYHPELARYSPGYILLLAMAEYAGRNRLRRIDLGKGDDFFKTRFMNASSTVAGGSVIAAPLLRRVRELTMRSLPTLRKLPLGKVRRVPARLTQTAARWWRFM